MQLVEEGGDDIEYVEMLNTVENDTTNLPENSELKQLGSYRDRLSVVTLSGGARLIIRDKTEILIPKRSRPKMIEILNFRHSWDGNT